METAARKITTNMIDEVEKVNALTKRVKSRKEEFMASLTHVSVIRSRLATESWKETDGEPLDLRRAKLFKKIMEGNPVVIKEGELIVGSQTQYVRGASPCIDYLNKTALEILESKRPLLSSSTVGAEELTEAERASLTEDTAYWKGKSPGDFILKAEHEVFGGKIDELLEARVSLDGFWRRPSWGKYPDYGKVIDIGFNGIITEAKEALNKVLARDFSDKDDLDKVHFLQSVIIACEGAIKFAHRHAELARELAGKESNAVRKKELEKIADICQWVPANPARSFHEALQSFWFTHLSVNLEGAFSSEVLGRMDQYLYPTYQKDIEESRLSRQEAAELLGCLVVKFSEMEVARGQLSRDQGMGSQFQHATIGGVTIEGKDATNELTYLLMEVSRQLKMKQPAIYLRCHRGTPEEVWMKALEVNKERGDGQPAYINDENVILNFVAKGIPMQEARDYDLSGCVHPHVSHKSGNDFVNLLSLCKMFELTLYNGVDPRTGKQLGPATGDPRNFSSWEELYDAFKKQVEYFIGIYTKYQHLVWQLRKEYYHLPFLSALMDDCISKGKGIYEGGLRYPQLGGQVQDKGHQDITNSLAAIKKLVFEDKKITMDRLLKALKANFEGNGNEEIRQMCLGAPKYGNDDDYVDDIFNDLSLWAQRRLSQEKHILGQPIRIARGGATHHYAFGKTVGALPSGRKAWEPLTDGALSATGGTDVKGPTALINSASKVNHTEINTSTLFNMKFSPPAKGDVTGMRKLIALIKTYLFERGGYQVQFNLMGDKILREARKSPEKHRDLLVRVAGYSAYFVDLAPEVQDEIISRTEHSSASI